MSPRLKILVTGGCGAIGSEVVNQLKLKESVSIVNLDKLTYAGRISHIEEALGWNSEYKFILGDICDAHCIGNVLKMECPDVIIHLAAETHVDNSFGNSLAFTQANVYGTHVLLECIRKHRESHNNFTMFLHMSTDEVYGSVEDGEDPRQEDALFAPSNPYSATKAAAEMICHAYMKSFGIPIVITRCNNAISKYQHEEKLIPRTIRNLLSDKRIPIHGRGLAKRTFIHAYDIADALWTIIHRGKMGAIYNIGSDEEYTVLQVVDKVLEHVKPGSELYDWIEFQEDRPFQDYRYSIDASALKEIGWKPRHTFADSIEYVLKHYLVSP
jgi:UDP-glucose 4,6-dehydratase